MRNINKKGFKFKFEIHVESVDKILSNGGVCVQWQRNSKILSTKPASIDGSRTAQFGGEILSQEITLFKKKKDNVDFDPKPFKLQLRQFSGNGKMGKVLGRIEVDFAEYVQIPSFSKRMSATLSSNSRLVMRITSTFLGEANVKKGSRGNSSIGSSNFESDAMSSTGPEDSRDTSLDDLNDLHVSTTFPAAAPQQPSARKVPPQKRTPVVPPPRPESPAQNVMKMGRRRPSNPSPNQSKGDLPPTQEKGGLFNRNRSNNGMNGNSGPSREEFEVIKRENRNLKRKNEDLNGDLEKLNERLDSNPIPDENTVAYEQLVEENDSLRRDMGDLEDKLSREPVYADVVRDLREAKMALAILTLENDELIQENRKLRKSNKLK